MSVQLSLTYDGALRCHLIHGPSSASLETDAPKDNAGRGESFSPTDLVAASLLSCAVTTMAIVGAREGIVLTAARGVVQKEMHASPRRIAALKISLELPAALDSTSRSRLEAIAQSCPVALSLSHDVEQRFTFAYPL